MKTIKGESKRYLEIDLTARSFTVFSPLEDELRAYIGGKGLGLKLFYDRMGRGKELAGLDPLGPDNILAFMMGTFIGTGAPCSARFAGLTKSPLTGIMVGSSCGGPFGMACKTAGWDGILVSGAASAPIVLRIDEAGASFEEAAGLWGLGTGEAQGRLVTEAAQAALVIGPAGENGVLYANIRSGERYLGRGGMGAVMGAKKLKAIVATGRSFKIEPAEPQAFERHGKRARKHINRNAFVLSYRAYGTNFGVAPGVKAGYAAVRNFRDRTDERCLALSGEAMAERYHTTHAVCSPCAVLCGHKGSYPDGKVRHIPEYETVGVWGGNIMNFDSDLVAEWNDIMNELGLDTISCGVTASWAMEAAEKGLRPSELAFGRTDNIPRILEDIAHRRGEGAELCLGSRRLAQKHGGLEFAAQVKGLEMAAYDPRGGWGQGLNYAVANRGGCHLNAYPIALEAIFNFIPPYTRLSKASWVAFFEDLFDAINAAQTCQFTAFGYLLEPVVAKYTPRFLLKLAMTLLPDVAQLVLDWGALSGLVSAITGRRVTRRDFLMAGRRSHVLERRMNMLMGIGAADDTLPARFLTEAKTKHGSPSVVPVEAMVKAYYRKKGYDRDGAPTPRLLASLGIPLPETRRGAAAPGDGQVGLLERVFCRTYQTVMRAAGYFLDFSEPGLLEGPGSLTGLPGLIASRGRHKLLVVTDKGIMSHHLLDGFLEGLKDAGLGYALFDRVEANPTIPNIKDALALYDAEHCDAIVAFGGGSSMDCAKAAGALASNRRRTLGQLRGLLKVWRRPPLLFAVPTTAGTGSETTVVAVVTDPSTHEKYAITDPKLMPDYAVLDPELTLGLPPQITATTGMDALTHAVEAYIGRSNTRKTREMAEKAVVLVFKSLEKAWADGSDIGARGDMLLASYCGGVAFTRAYVGYVHAIAHNLGGLYGIPHGLANAVILPYVLEYFGESAQTPLARLAELAGLCAPGPGTGEAAKARAFIEAVKGMGRRMGIPSGFSQIREEDIQLLMRRTLKEGNPLYPVPRLMGRADCETLVRGLMA